MNIGTMFLKLKKRFYHKFTKPKQMNEYDKMKVETILKHELKIDNLNAKDFIPPTKSNERDVSAI